MIGYSMDFKYDVVNGIFNYINVMSVCFINVWYKCMIW